MAARKRLYYFVMVFLVIFSFLMLPLLGGNIDNAAAQEPIKLKFAHHNPPQGRTTVKFLTPWEKSVEEATNGKVEIVQYPAQSLAKSKQTYNAVKGGIADIGWVILDMHPGKFPLTDVMGLPFLPLYSEGSQNSVAFQKLYESSPEMQKHFKGVKVLFVHASTPYKLMTKQPVRNNEDIKGLKLRVIGAPQSQATEIIGATPLAMPMPGVYEAADKGVIDGAALPWTAVATMRLNEVFDYWTDVKLWLAKFAMVMNQDTWESLPPDVQDQVMSACGVNGAELSGNAWTPKVREVIEEQTKGTKDEMTRVELEEGVYEQWKETAGKPVWKDWVQKMEKKGLPGQEVLDKTLELLKQ